MSDRKNHRREARRSVQKLNRAGVVTNLYTKETLRHGHDACANCHEYALLCDWLCLTCSLAKDGLRPDFDMVLKDGDKK